MKIGRLCFHWDTEMRGRDGGSRKMRVYVGKEEEIIDIVKFKGTWSITMSDISDDDESSMYLLACMEGSGWEEVQKLSVLINRACEDIAELSTAEQYMEKIVAEMNMNGIPAVMMKDKKLEEAKIWGAEIEDVDMDKMERAMLAYRMRG